MASASTVLNSELVARVILFAKGGVQSHLLLAIRYRLAEMANNGLVAF
jgi:hypothetical protein